MLCAGTSVEEAFRVQSLVSTPTLQNLIVLYKISSNLKTLQIVELFSSVALKKKVPQSEEFTILSVKIGPPIN
jgi:hypothetical protein